MSLSIDQQIAAATREYQSASRAASSCSSELASLRGKRDEYARRKAAVERVQNRTYTGFHTSDIKVAQTHVHENLEYGMTGHPHRAQVAAAIQGDYEKGVTADARMSEVLGLMSSEIRRLERLIDSSDSSMRSCQSRLNVCQTQKATLRRKIVQLKAQRALGIGQV